MSEVMPKIEPIINPWFRLIFIDSVWFSSVMKYVNYSIVPNATCVWRARHSLTESHQCASSAIHTVQLLLPSAALYSFFFTIFRYLVFSFEFLWHKIMKISRKYCSIFQDIRRIVLHTLADEAY